MAEVKKMSKVNIIKTFFGLKEGQNSLQFLAEYKELNDKERQYLATLAAKELGVEVESI